MSTPTDPRIMALRDRLRAEHAAAMRADVPDVEREIHASGLRQPPSVVRERIRGGLLLMAGHALAGADLDLSPVIAEYGGAECAVQSLALAAAAMARWQVLYDLRDVFEDGSGR